MSKNVVILALLFAAVLGNVYFAYERSSLKKQCDRLRHIEAQMKKDSEAEKQAWTKLYKDCVEENNVLVSKLKELSSAGNRLSN